VANPAEIYIESVNRVFFVIFIIIMYHLELTPKSYELILCEMYGREKSQSILTQMNSEGLFSSFIYIYQSNV
jgi:hypothetical protein